MKTDWTKDRIELWNIENELLELKRLVERELREIDEDQKLYNPHELRNVIDTIMHRYARFQVFRELNNE